MQAREEIILKKLFLFTISIILLTVTSCSNVASVVPTFNSNLLGTNVVQTADAALVQTAINATSTFTPTPTFINAPELFSTATFTPFAPGSFKPGDPTATPLGNDITDLNFIEGVKAYDAKNFEKVITLMSVVIEANPELAPPYRYRGITYMQLGSCSKALVDFEQALSINPDYAVAWAGRALANGCLGNETQQFLDFQKALLIDPSLAFVHENLGVYYYHHEDYEKSLEEYTLSVSIDPHRASAWNGKGEALTKLGRFAECIENSTKAIEIDPKEWLAYSDRAFCELGLQNYTEAVADYEVYVAQDATDPIVWYNLGISQRHSGNPDGAVDSYNKSLKLDPSYYPAYINRGYAYLTLEKYKEALVDYNKALEFGDIPAAYAGRADTYYGMGEYNKAIDDYKKATTLNPSDAHSYCFLSLSNFEAQKYQDSIDAAQMSQQIDPTCGRQRLIETQARSFFALGNNDQALVYINKALAMGDYSLGHYYRGIIYQAAGKNQEAIQDLELFLSLIQGSESGQAEITDAKARLVKLKQ